MSIVNRLVYISVIWVGLWFPTQLMSQSNLEIVRKEFEKAQTEEDFQRILDIPTSKNDDEIIIIESYQAVCHSAMAQFVFNPYTKYKMFNEGKDRLEVAISKEQGVENTFLRLIVQLNTPSFLGYSSNIEEDLAYLKAHLLESSIPLNTKKFIVKTIIESDNDKYELDSLSLLLESKTQTPI